MAKRPLRLLYLEDRKGFQYEVKKAVQKAGDRLIVDVVSDVATAREHLRLNFYHLLVLDINIETVKSDLTNQDGLTFLMLLEQRNLLGRAFEACILTAFSNPKYATSTMNQTRAIGYYNKRDFSRQKFVEWVDEMQTRQFNFPLNLALQIENKPALAPLLAAQQPFVDAPVSTEMLAHELEDLLCRVFAHEDAVTWAAPPDFSDVASITLYIDASGVTRELRVFYLPAASPDVLKQAMQQPDRRRFQTMRFGVFVPESIYTEAADTPATDETD